MANNNVTTLVYRGKLEYAKVLGDPVLNYNKDGQEWKFDFVPNDPDSAQKELKGLGVGDRLRSLEDSEGNPRYDGQKYMTFKQNATRRDGSPNKGINVVDIKGNPWPEDVLLGNDTVADVKFVVIDNGKGKFHGVYPRSIRVLELKPFTKQEFEPIDEDDEYAKAAEEQAKTIAMLAGTPKGEPKDRSDDDLDDDLPDDLTA